MIRSALLLLCLLAVSVGRLAAQPGRGAPFETLDVEIGGTFNTNRTLLHDFWKPGYGVEGQIATPFYLGEAVAGGAFHRYGVVADVPAFDALLLVVGWGLPLSLGSHLRWHNAFTLGNYRMTFDDDTFAGVRNESELILGLQSRLHVHLSQAWSLYVGGRYDRVFTEARMPLFFVSAGLSHTLRTPRWLRTFLQ